MKKLFFFLYFLIQFNLASACCFGTRHSLTEVLANQNSKHDIFTCEIIASYNGPGYTSKAVVKDIYRGNPLDTIYLVTGGHTTAGGSMIFPGTEWLVVGRPWKNNHYSATICFDLSRRIDDKEIKCSKFNNKEGLKFLDIIQQYFQLESEKYTGGKTLRSGELRFVDAAFKNGKADGKWVHYKYNRDHKNHKILSEIEYKNGVIDGLSIKYTPDYDTLIVDSETFVKHGLIQWENKYNRYINTYTYDTTASLKDHQAFFLGKTLDTLKIENVRTIDYNNEENLSIWFKHGYYYNIQDSSSRKPLCKGYYYKGAKVGKWEYLNKSGKTVQVIEYNYPDTTSTLFQSFDEDGNISYEGKLLNNHRIGRWNRYYKGKLESEFYFNRSSKLEVQVRHYQSGRRSVSPFKNGLVHGSVMMFDSSEQLISIDQYVNGVKNGKSVSYNKLGQVNHESLFKNGRETTLYSTSSNAPKTDGIANGYNVQYSGRDGHKMYEGEIFKGFYVGKHINYRKNGEYSFTYYKFKKGDLNPPCYFESIEKVEHYDKEGILTSTGKY